MRHLLLSAVLATSACNHIKIDTNSPSEVSPSEEASPYFPKNSVIAFDQASCPTGWVEFTPLKGRFILGAGSGNLDSAGGALTTRTWATSGGLEYTTGIPVVSAAPNSSNPGTGGNLALADIFTNGTVNVSLNASAVDSNLPPYIVRKFCKKIVSTQTDTSGASVATKLASCDTGWGREADVKGRAFLGEGSGNTDRLGAALATRTLNVIGGQESTPNVPACAGGGDGTFVPGPTKCLAGHPIFNLFTGLGADGTLSGTATDSNLPPFYVLLVCKATINTDLPQPGMVAAFDQATCPAGWSRTSELSGRFLLASNDVAGTVSLRTEGDAGGLEYTTGLLYDSSDPADIDSPVELASLALSSGFSAYRSSSTPDTTLTGPKADSNLPPYYVLTFCHKD